MKRLDETQTQFLIRQILNEAYENAARAVDSLDMAYSRSNAELTKRRCAQVVRNLKE
jgi:hypothetical protein